MSDKTTTKRLKLAGLLAIAAMAVMAVVASAAFGFSEFKVPSGQKFPVKFHGEGGLSIFTTEKGATIMCNKSLSTGEVTGSTTAKALVTYSGNCKLAGAPLGNGACTEPIMINELNVSPATIVGHLGNNRGELFLPSTAGGAVANLKCTSASIKVIGGVICESSPSGKFTTTGTVTCAQGSKSGEQLYATAEVGGKSVAASLTAEATDIFTITEKDDQATVETLTYEKEIEQT